MVCVDFFLWLFLPLAVLAFQWDYTHDFELKKDEIASIIVTKRSDNSQKILTLRWTLFQNERLVLLVNYDGFPTQYIIQKEYKRNSIKITLRDDYSESSSRCYLILNLQSFDEASKVARLKASIIDPKKRVEIQFRDSQKK